MVKTMKYLIYARVSPKGSSWDSGETTIQMQFDYCREYVKFHGGEVVGELSDEFYSGKDSERPAFKQLLADLKSDKAEWDTLIVYKMSRFTRSLKDGTALFEMMYQHGKGFVSATEKLDFSTPSGRAMLGILQVFNQFEREQTAENIRNRMTSIAAKGLWPVGNPPFGYRRGEKKDNRLYIEPRNAEIVKDIYEMYVSSQHTTNDILEKYRETLSRQQIFCILRNKAYLGKIDYAGNVFQGQHEAIISDALYDEVQAKLPQPKTATRPKAQKYPYLLAGLIKCSCGRSMTPASAKHGRYHYYVCTDAFCKNRVTAKDVEDAAILKLKDIKATKTFFNKIRDEIEKAKKVFLEASGPELDNAITAKTEAMKERECVYKTILNLKNYSEADFLNNRLNYLTREIDRLQARIDILKSETKDINAYDYAKEEIDNLKDLSQLLTHALENNDSDLLRQIILSKVERVDHVESNKFKIKLTTSTSKCKEWWSISYLEELFLFEVL